MMIKLILSTIILTLELISLQTAIFVIVKQTKKIKREDPFLLPVAT